MSKTPHTQVPESTTQTKIWIDNDLLEFVDEMAQRDDRSRAYVVNQALRSWRNKLIAVRQWRKDRKPKA